MHVTIRQSGDEDADSDTMDSEYARKAAAFAAARKRKASFHYKGWYGNLSCENLISMKARDMPHANAFCLHTVQKTNIRNRVTYNFSCQNISPILTTYDSNYSGYKLNE